LNSKQCYHSQAKASGFLALLGLKLFSYLGPIAQLGSMEPSGFMPKATDSYRPFSFQRKKRRLSEKRKEGQKKSVCRVFESLEHAAQSLARPSITLGPFLLLRLFFCTQVLLSFFCYTERRSGLSGSYARFVSR